MIEAVRRALPRLSFCPREGCFVLKARKVAGSATHNQGRAGVKTVLSFKVGLLIQLIQPRAQRSVCLGRIKR